MLATLLNLCGITALYSRVRNNKLIILNYHRIAGANHATDFDNDVFGHSAATFRNQLLWLRDHFEMIDEARLIELATGGPFQLDRNSALITFDDGYADNYQLAYPILKELGVPAIFFVPYNMIENRELGWWDLISWAIHKTGVKSATYGGSVLDLSTDAQKAATAKSLHAYVKATDYSQTKDVVNDLAQVLEVELPGADVQSRELMTWEQLREVSRNGVAVGSHSMSHRLLSRISDEDQAWEMSQSKILIEQKLGLPVNSIAYPVGKQNAYNEASRRLAKEAGYKVGFSFTTGYYRGVVDDAFDIKRIALGTNPALYTSEVVFPGIFAR